jgi:hypothetical protein
VIKTERPGGVPRAARSGLGFSKLRMVSRLCARVGWWVALLSPMSPPTGRPAHKSCRPASANPRSESASKLGVKLAARLQLNTAIIARMRRYIIAVALGFERNPPLMKMTTPGQEFPSRKAPSLRQLPELPSRRHFG